MTRVLLTGAAGQIGTELASALAADLGPQNVLVTDVRDPGEWHRGPGPAAVLDCLDPAAVNGTLAQFRPDHVYHLAAVLSATGEKRPQRAWELNVGSLINVLEAARAHPCRLFVPSSIAAFGPAAPRNPTPQRTIQRPNTMYGITKVAGELLCDYYHSRFDVDVRGVRFPGLISYTAPPGGGTTDYAVEIFHAAVQDGHYTCFLGPDTRLDMMYLADGIRAARELMEAPGESLEDRNAYNITAMQFTPAELARAIQRVMPEFTIDYDPDSVRQAIADSWPERLDDSAARAQWGWKPHYGLERMVEVMLEGASRMRSQDEHTV
ncbi:MAG: NAD-dependent epimerase/dehydratase family protein [Gemmatimonadota bacterium]|nr:NAD-dependent epimerase/dehydratase family protein [Gemmatimonadota bacterium]